MKNAINWFEIPAADFNRAVQFYSAVFNTQLTAEQMGPIQMAVFPSEGTGTVAGAVCAGEMYSPSATGTMVYLNANGQMNDMLARITNAGGTVVMPRTVITPEIGYMAVFRDTEGNHVSLHSND